MIIKMFEEYSRKYFEISYDDFRNADVTEYYDDFTDREIDELKKYSEKDCHFQKDIVRLSSYLTITKNVDEWYYVQLSDGGGNDAYYKCDQFSGLIALLNCPWQRS